MLFIFENHFYFFFFSPHVIMFVYLLLSFFFWLQYPVYFAFENDDIDAVLSDIKRNDATGQPATATTGGSVETLLLRCIPS